MSLDQLELIRLIHPLRRDLVSPGFDQAMDMLAVRFPLKIHRFASGTRCWTWVVPPAWGCREGFLETLDGRRLLDQAWNPLYVASYSQKTDGIFNREELEPYLYAHPRMPAAPPFIWFYYQPGWGFGCPAEVKDRLGGDRYRAVIDSSFQPGELKVAELVLEGREADSFILCGHLCHPAQANDGLSGVVTGLAVMQELARRGGLRYTYRLLIVPETIGSVAWLSRHEDLIPLLKGGLFLDMTGLDLPPVLQLSYFGDTQVDRCLSAVHLESEAGAWCAPWRQAVGNDERQFNAPGVRVPMLSYARALPWGNPDRPFAQYHSAADDPSLVNPLSLEKSKQTVLNMIEAWEDNYFPCNLFKGEVFLAGYGLAPDRHRALTKHRDALKIMDMIDGTNSLADIAHRLKMDYFQVRDFVRELRRAGLVRPAPRP